MEFVPAFSVWTALSGLVFLPVLLALLARPPFKLRPPGRRFQLSALIIFISWAAAQFTQDAPESQDLLIGGILLTGGLLCASTLWTLLAWGFTVFLLLALAGNRDAPSLDDWIARYTAGRGVTMFTRDRAGVLLRFGLARVVDGRFRITDWPGRKVLAAARLVARIFGIAL